MAKVLIVVDMQQDFIESCPELVDKVVIECTKPEYDLVIATADAHDYMGYSFTKESKYYSPHCMSGSEGQLIPTEIVSNVDMIVPKITFGSIGLVDYLLTYSNNLIDDAIKEINICGVCTDICVLANAILVATAFQNAEITVLEDLCHGTTDENHENALKAMEQCLIFHKKVGNVE